MIYIKHLFSTSNILVHNSNSLSYTSTFRFAIYPVFLCPSMDNLMYQEGRGDVLISGSVVVDSKMEANQFFIPECYI